MDKREEIDLLKFMLTETEKARLFWFRKYHKLYFNTFKKVTYGKEKK